MFHFGRSQCICCEAILSHFLGRLNQRFHNYLENFLHDNGRNPDSFIIEKKSSDLSIYMDAGHLKQILDNLCSNALKYGNIITHKIIIEVSLTNNCPCIRILDHGLQIDDDTAKNLFSPFFTTSASGTGLGLYISRELAELNQAKLSYTPAHGENCFTLCLPNADNSKIEI